MVKAQTNVENDKGNGKIKDKGNMAKKMEIQNLLTTLDAKS